LSYVFVRQLFVGTVVSTFRHERPSTVGRIYTKMQCRIYVMIFNLINHEL
jgi:predicted membrane channel-forming protein YqfA (hemolysin III family)